MHPKFAALTETLHSSYEKLMACAPHTGRERLPLTTPRCGVYVFTELGEHLYVGRTDRLRARHKEHWNGKQNDAPFAFKLARHATNNLRTKGGLTRTQLEKDPAFAAAFSSAKDRVAAMEFRWVAEEEANRQYLLEIYVAVALGAPYNDFMNH